MERSVQEIVDDLYQNLIGQLAIKETESQLLYGVPLTEEYKDKFIADKLRDIVYREKQDLSKCTIFCDHCSESFVILNRETIEDKDYYICSMCREFAGESKRHCEENSFENKEVIDQQD